MSDIPGEKEGLEFPSIDDCEPDEQGGPIARSGFTYQDYFAARLILSMVGDPAIEKIHCETMDDIVIVWKPQDGSPRVVEFVQVKTTTKNSLWTCARLCGSANDEPGTSLFEKSLSKDRAKEDALFQIVTSQGVQSALKPLTYEREHAARDLACEPMLSLRADMDARCPAAVSKKGATSADWLKRTLWIESPSVESLESELLISIISRSAHSDGLPLLVGQAEKILLSLLDWVRRAGDAKYIPDKDKKIISRPEALQWWSDKLDDERKGQMIASGGKLRLKLTPEVASTDMVENALELRRQFSEEIRSPKYMDISDVESLSMDVRSRLVPLRMQRFTGENPESPSAFHQRCVNAAEAAAAIHSEKGGVAKTMALGCLYDIVDRCQLAFSRDAE